MEWVSEKRWTTLLHTYNDEIACWETHSDSYAHIYIGLRLLPVWADSATLSHVTVESVSTGSPADQNGIYTLPR